MVENKRRSRLESENKSKSNRPPKFSGKFYLLASIVQLILLISFIVFFFWNFEMKSKLGETKSDLIEYKRRIDVLENENANFIKINELLKSDLIEYKKRIDVLENEKANFTKINKLLNEEITNLEIKIREKSSENISLAKENQDKENQLYFQRSRIRNLKEQLNDLLSLISQIGLPKEIESNRFKSDILDKILIETDKQFIQKVYIKSHKKETFILKKYLDREESIKLKKILNTVEFNDISIYEQYKEDIFTLQKKINDIKITFENE